MGFPVPAMRRDQLCYSGYVKEHISSEILQFSPLGFKEHVTNCSQRDCPRNNTTVDVGRTRPKAMHTPLCECREWQPGAGWALGEVN